MISYVPFLITMPALNHKLQQILLDADGRYLSSEELRPFEDYVKTYENRLSTYQVLSKYSNEFVLSALKQFARLHPDIIKKSGKRCHYDMTQVLRHIALCILIDDEIIFRETMMIWLDTMIRAHRKQEACYKAYQFLQDAMNHRLPESSRQLVAPYTALVLESFQPYS